MPALGQTCPPWPSPFSPVAWIGQDDPIQIVDAREKLGFRRCDKPVHITAQRSQTLMDAAQVARGQSARRLQIAFPTLQGLEPLKKTQHIGSLVTHLTTSFRVARRSLPVPACLRDKRSLFRGPNKRRKIGTVQSPTATRQRLCGLACIGATPGLRASAQARVPQRSSSRLAQLEQSVAARTGFPLGSGFDPWSTAPTR